MGDLGFSNNLVHYLLLRLVMKQVDDEYQMWFRIGNEMLHFSLREWCLVTGLKCGNVENLHKKYLGDKYVISISVVHNTLSFFMLNNWYGPQKYPCK